MWPGFDSPIRRLMWAEFVGSLSCSERFFSGYSGFPLSPKANISPTRPHKLTALNCVPCINKVSLAFYVSAITDLHTQYRVVRNNWMICETQQSQLRVDNLFFISFCLFKATNADGITLPHGQRQPQGSRKEVTLLRKYHGVDKLSAYKMGNYSRLKEIQATRLSTSSDEESLHSFNTVSLMAIKHWKERPSLA